LFYDLYYGASTDSISIFESHIGWCATDFQFSADEFSITSGVIMIEEISLDLIIP
jgi:hypothetical protein